ncbi:hypothetical protein ACLB2K_013326 [Fragaria x ananassa]
MRATRRAKNGGRRRELRQKGNQRLQRTSSRMTALHGRSPAQEERGDGGGPKRGGPAISGGQTATDGDWASSGSGRAHGRERKCGLGIKKSADMNQAMLSKIGWRIFQHDNGLWANVFYPKYLQHDCLFGNDYKPPSDVSTTWGGVMHGAELIKKNLKWRVRNGNSIKFLYEFWLLPQALNNFALPSVVIFEDVVISSFWNAKGWDVELLLSVLPSEIVNLIVNVPNGFSESGDDTRICYTMHAWKKPPDVFSKLNVDGIGVSPIGNIGAGGVIRNHYGDWISGFQISLGVGEILDAEAWDHFQGLKLAASLNIKNLIIESDYQSWSSY